MIKEVKELFDNYNSVMVPFSQGMIKLTNYLIETSPDIAVYFPRSGVVFEDLINEILTVYNLPKFKSLTVQAGIQGAQDYTIKAVKEFSEKNNRKEYSLAVVPDEVSSGTCLKNIFSAYYSNFFKTLNKELNIEHLILTGLVTHDDTELLEYKLNKRTINTLKAYHSFDCEIVKIFFDSISYMYNNMNVPNFTPKEPFSFSDLMDEVDTKKDYENRIDEMLIILGRIYNQTRESLFAIHEFNPSFVKDKMHFLDYTLHDRLKKEGIIISNKQSINELVKISRVQKPELFNVKKTNLSVEYELFQAPVPFVDTQELLPVDKKWVNGIPVCTRTNSESSYQFYELTKFTLHKLLDYFNQKDWKRRVLESKDEDFKKEMFHLFNENFNTKKRLLK